MGVCYHAPIQNTRGGCMSVIVKAPKCRDGMLKNHLSTVKDESVEWKSGLAEVSEETWEVLKGIPGYELCESKATVISYEPGVESDIEEIGHENSENLELLSTEIPSNEEIDENPVTETIVESDEIQEPPKIADKMVTVDNTVKEIRAFASDNGIAIGNAQSKKDLLKKINKHFE